MLRNISTIFMTLVTLFFTAVSSAKNINLYEQPKSDAKIIGTIDPATGIIPIFTPKEGDWVKVGNPNNGNVGWVKSSDLAQAGATSSGFSFSQKIDSTGKGPQSYVFKFGMPAQLTKEQSDALYKQIQAQQAAIQQSVQKIIQETLTHYNQTGVTGWEFPIIMPVVIMPPNAAGTKTTPTNQQHQ